MTYSNYFKLLNLFTNYIGYLNYVGAYLWGIT
jgi:hypothetical protein